jgi:cyclopropane fatty-acyl-phospholipid synthase-like methyltransferase
MRLSYAYTVREWARALQAHRAALALRFGSATGRTFLLLFWASYHFLTTNRTQGYHLGTEDGRATDERA